ESKAKEAVEKEQEKAADKGIVLTDEQQQKIYEDAYKESMNQGMSAMGSDTRQGIDMAVSIINGLISGDMAGAAAGALAPKIATIIKQHTEGDIVANTVSHAILGAVVAELQGNSALVGGLGAAASERGAEVIAGILYPDKDIKDLSQEERQQISALSQLATGLAIAASGGDIQDVNTGVAAGKNAVENNYFGQAIVNAAKSQCDGNKDCEDKLIKEGIDSYNETIIEYGTPQVIAIGAVIAAPIVEPAIVACSANPVLCANQVATWLIETVGFEGNPAMGLGMTASVYVNSLSKAELNELAAIMTLEKNKLIKNSSPLIDELKVTLSEDSAHKLVYDKATNSIIKQGKAGKGTTGQMIPDLPKTREKLYEDLKSKGFTSNGQSQGGYETWKGPDGVTVTIKPTGEVIRTQRVWKSDRSGKYSERQDYFGNRLPDQSHSTGHFVE
ncbi:VENN motif pre-toxin domain-containing protein, partial [Gilliamella sp. Bim3-2]